MTSPHYTPQKYIFLKKKLEKSTFTKNITPTKQKLIICKITQSFCLLRFAELRYVEIVDCIELNHNISVRAFPILETNTTFCTK